MADPVLSFTERGIYCPAADIYIDPWRPVPRALITHAHSDHARPGHGSYLATPVTAAMIRHRLGVEVETLPYAEPRRIGGATVSFHPAGHVPGSAQVRVEVGGEVWVVSGDYKLETDGLSEPFEPVRCHAFITECTFGLPVFRWQPQAEIAAEINGWWRANRAAGRASLLGAYSLGKAQRLISMLDPEIGPILTHGAVEGSNAVLREIGAFDRETIPVTPDFDRKAHPAPMVVAPPSAFGTSWARKFGPAQTGFASGWMRLRGVRRRRGVQRGFVISDHADWPALLRAIKETGAENIYPTHGYTDIFAQYLRSEGYDATPVPTEFGGDEDAAEKTGDAA
ncbi:ligase-associated DNA damage response exonuclease [Salipiger sp. PrR002]|uniref:ligase-associated DNA damage response exonuclease n=1 Tax=Salipiger sp. PrR002 TaxID=2706489 RepID=UPI0013B7FA26|nr:ligase-associated DNA damage response exonuclease [Salipiger sp. PrR002]NDW01057.1 ligase-associated DNA damage response exonuclease [Salipiger sp. PrR002]NDW58540.1 ligase-associated DNA damage response exonuclease [Salipiger sp. PrR004]